ncbi:hypothetical protein HNQ93_002486 [Hymenobacter luteus]|uniref:Type I-B CRISPR-associated protein Cas8b1/Cst1 n=2 Tax=Hymenobacter TaxID=89966 RepID=A0A7W9T109_9BACT|nr:MULTISPECIES: hypothetical protein [Hymenobacter]MBB4601945.1 hypothetical protein [Hymenobacter latericoloratus]MBB6059626.1 hypothetical protein [Hymenobacter luteus]
MQRISFPYSGNVFLDNGTVALYHYLQQAARLTEHDNLQPLQPYELSEGRHFGLMGADGSLPEHVWVEHPRLYELLEELYYAMGREVYDTYTHKQMQKGGNLYFTLTGEVIQAFPKMNTYGFTHLLTNNAQGGTRRKENSRKFKDIENKDPALAARLDAGYTERGVKRDKKVYFNEPYTKITRLDAPTAAHFAPGPHRCYLTGESVKTLVEAQNISPFLSSSMSMFNSGLSSSDKKVSWKAMYLSRFAAAACLYQYPNKLREALNVYFLHADSLEHLHTVVVDRLYRGIQNGLGVEQLREEKLEFQRNFRASEALGKPGDFVGVYETLFVVLHSLREQVLRVELPLKEPVVSTQEAEPADEEWLDPTELLFPTALRGPLALYFLRAESFAATMRPKVFDKLFNFHYAIGLIGHLQLQKIPLKAALQSLKVLKPSQRTAANAFQQERQLRERVVGRMLQGQSILEDVEGLLYDCYGYLLDGLADPKNGPGWKHYSALLHLTELYEKLTNSHIMEQSALQERAIKLGAQIGQGILNYQGKAAEKGTANLGQRQINAKQGRKYIVALRKARRYPDFLEQLSRVQMRYGLLVSRELLDTLTEAEFPWVKQFILLSALNQLNTELNPKKSDNSQPSA